MRRDPDLGETPSDRPRELTLEDARESLTAHVAAKGAEIRAKYGPTIGWGQLQRILEDPAFVRYPCELAFDASPLEPDECAYPAAKGERPEDGFRLCIHPYFSVDPARVPLLALYQLVAINYGAFASPDDAEAFGAAALGMERDHYYAALCAMADEISTGHLAQGETGPSACQCGALPEDEGPGVPSEAPARSG
ncbi:MAG TPA: hypothetical protein VMG58_10545 [Candidatus Sulfotelmatobacter sp.]|nr:hypothetical protein [Candidatus Sulfotelmatobacter sp.]